MVPDLAEQLLLYLVILPFDRGRKILGLFQVLLGHFQLLFDLLEPDLQRCVLLSRRVTLLLHPRNLREQRLIVLLHLIDLRLMRVLLISVVISALFHLPELHLIAFDLALQLLYLPLMRVVMLQLMQLPLKPLNRRGFSAEFILDDLVLILEALDLVLQCLHGLHNVGRFGRALTV